MEPDIGVDFWVNEKAYGPEIVAIGPYHPGKESPQMMEEQKLRYLQLLLKSNNENSADKYVTAIRLLEQKTCRCYAEPISLTVKEMIEMMLLEGCFIIELMHKFEMEFLRDENDSIFEMDWMVNSLQGNLMSFESHLPFFVLCKKMPQIEEGTGLSFLIPQSFEKLESGYRRLLRKDRNLGAERLRERRQLKSFANNSSLCGPVTGKPCPGSPPFAPSPFVPPSTISSPSGNSGTGAIAGGVAAGAALLFAAPAIGFAW
ncbi:UPF0481 protein [Camellia lanceoleosa]|uniref:UPF0481 protein n=1 Tax=Camellia lanceoleosa TaxID=1840588 RepID=A0ACC0GP43_9ERIC|nr:UPF0481 protein [Camellia lanceoleosa]